MICKDFENWVRSRNIFEQEDGSAGKRFNTHLDTCPACSGIYTVDQALENRIKAVLGPEKLPDGLVDQVNISIDHAIEALTPGASSPYKKIGLAAGFLLIAAIAALFFFNQPVRYDTLHQLGESIVAGHLEGDTAMSFTADQIDQARIMMSRELQFNVVLPNLKDQGYTLLGGRVCALGKCKIAYLFYRKLDKICSLFILDYDQLNFKMADGSQFTNSMKGLNTRIWKKNGQVYALVF